MWNRTAELLIFEIEFHYQHFLRPVWM